MNDGERRNELLKDIPKHYFNPNSKGRVAILCWILLITLSQLAIIYQPNFGLVASIITGLSMGPLFFKAHDLSHRSVACNERSRYCLQLIAWCPNFFPATLWQSLHMWHHKHTNTMKDSDRNFVLSDKKSLAKRIYAFIFLPVNGSGAKPNPLMLLAFVAYSSKYISAAIFNTCLSTCTAIPDFKTKQRISVLFEVILSLSFYVGLALWSLSAGNSLFHALVFHVAIPLMISSTISMLIIFTQHFCNPILDKGDILESTTSIRLPRIMHYLTSNIGFHVEHHLFPTMNPQHYPEVSKLIEKKWPDSYKSVSFIEAWAAIFNTTIFEPVLEHS